MWGRANLDAADHAVTGSVDDAHCRSTVATDVDFATVWRHDQTVRARWHWNGGQHTVGSRIQHSNGLVFEQPDVSLADGRGRRVGRGLRRCQSMQHQQQEEREHTPYPGERPSASRRHVPVLSGGCIDVLALGAMLYEHVCKSAPTHSFVAPSSVRYTRSIAHGKVPVSHLMV